MSYHSWFHKFFNEKHKSSLPKDKVAEVIDMLDFRGQEYLQHNYEHYKDLYIKPEEDIINSKPQIIQQVKNELIEFLELIVQKNVKSILQIGLGHFGSTHFCLSLLVDKIVTIDIDIKNITNYTDREILHNANKEIFILGDSTDKNVISQVSNHGPFDCIFIDGNHSYEYVKNDMDNYLPFLKTNGICAFHDALLSGDRYGTPEVLKNISEKITYIAHSKEVGIAFFIKK